MRVISKKISLEDFTSRLPGVVPAYKDGKLYKFDEKSLKDREYQFPSNYGMIPLSVKVPSEIEVPILSGKTRILSWETISDWYHFFTDYYHLLNDWGHCHIIYNSAIEYYDHESKNGYADQMEYGVMKSTYIDLDELFEKRGGKATYDWICKNIIPSIEIPDELVDIWHCKRLYYPDIVKWRSWFEKRKNYTSPTSCSSTTDCCDCEEYFKRGEDEMRNLLNNFKLPNIDFSSTITPTIGCSGETVQFTKNECETAIEMPISLQVSIDDMGEFSIFSKEYELGIDYRTARYGDSANTNSGTVISIDGESMKLISGSGFTFDSTYMEKKFSKDDWAINSGDTICSGITEEDEETRYYQKQLDFKYYGFGEDWVKFSAETEPGVREQIKREYGVEEINSIFINGILYPIETEEFGLYKGSASKMYFVYRENYTQTPYTIINGKKTYGTVKPIDENNYFYFPFFLNNEEEDKDTSRIIPKSVTCEGGEVQFSLLDIDCDDVVFDRSKYKWFPREKSTDSLNLKNFIMYNSVPYEITSSSGVTINGNEYNRIIGIFSNGENDFYVGFDNNVYYSSDGYLVLDENYKLSPDGSVVIKESETEIPVYNAKIITGTAASKLYELRSNNLLTDDVGDVIQARYNVSGRTNHQPNQGEELDLIYEVGNTNRIQPFEDAGDGLYFGDIITSMSFYYKKYDTGEKVGETQIDFSHSGTSLSAIQKSTTEAASEISGNTVEQDIYCDIEYVIGATLSGTPNFITYDGDNLFAGNKYEIADTSGIKYSPGVKYKETVKFKKTNVEYKLAAGIAGQIPRTFNSVSGNNLSYPVIVYELEQNIQEIESDYGSKYEYAIADFEMQLPPSNSGWTGYKSAIQIFPVFRQEYMLGSSVMQNVDVDIYIDRGINAAFEKHLKLGEVTSMEALENYTNGYFKMMDN